MYFIFYDFSTLSMYINTTCVIGKNIEADLIFSLPNILASSWLSVAPCLLSLLDPLPWSYHFLFFFSFQLSHGDSL